MHRMIRVLDGRTCLLVGNVVPRLRHEETHSSDGAVRSISFLTTCKCPKMDKYVNQCRAMAVAYALLSYHSKFQLLHEKLWLCSNFSYSNFSHHHYLKIAFDIHLYCAVLVRTRKRTDEHAQAGGRSQNVKLSVIYAQL